MEDRFVDIQMFLNSQVPHSSATTPTRGFNPCVAPTFLLADIIRIMYTYYVGHILCDPAAHTQRYCPEPFRLETH